jgi:hypothetical protein
MKQKVIKVKSKETGKIMLWTLSDILNEINRDRSNHWTDYNKNDWLDGWNDWIEEDNFYTIYNDKKQRL